MKTILGAFFPSLVVEPHLADRMYPLSTKFAFMVEESGYSHLHATKPDTVGEFIKFGFCYVLIVIRVTFEDKFCVNFISTTALSSKLLSLKCFSLSVRKEKQREEFNNIQFTNCG